MRRTAISAVSVVTTVLWGSLMPLPSSAAEGERFVGAGERTEGNTRQIIPRTGCRPIAENLSICLDGSPVMLEDSRADRRDRLEICRVDDQRRAAMREPFYDLGTAFELDADGGDALAQRYLFEDAPREPWDLERLIEERRTPSGWLHTQTSIVETSTDGRALFQAVIRPQQLGLAIIETTIGLPNDAPAEPDLERATAFRDSFLGLTRTSVNAGPGF